MNSKLFLESYKSHGVPVRKNRLRKSDANNPGKIAYKQNGLQSADKMDQNGLYTESSHPSPTSTMDVLSPKYLPGITWTLPPKSPTAS